MAQWYRTALAGLVNKEIDFDSDSLKWTLHTATYTPNLDTHRYVSDLSNELATGGGYTSGGITLTSPTMVYTAANAWAATRANSTAYTVGQIIRPASGNGFLYRCVTAGTTASSYSAWATDAATVNTDGTAKFVVAGAGIIVLDAADPSWSAATFTAARYAVLSDRTAGSASAQPLLGLIDFGANKDGGGGAFTITLDAQGVLQILVP